MKTLSLTEARQKANTYCNFQERCQAEVLEKLRSWGLHYEHANSIISDLIEQGLINEERFARAYVRGKFTIKKWGRNKILKGLKEKRISPRNIQCGLTEIEEDVYLETMKTLAEKKYKEHKGNAVSRKQKTGLYLQQKGYESHLIWKVLDSIGNKGS